MRPEDLRLLRQLFDQAADLPASEREAWLSKQTIPASIRARLFAQLQMLAANARPLAEPVVRPTTDSDPLQIGPYRVLHRLGEGGMGVVFAAEQTHPVRRTVAIKRVRFGLDSASILARFELERRTLARLDHPSIAHVLEVGSDEDGLPWFAMELCDGPTVTAYCDEKQLSIEGRLQLFIAACRGLEHAHQRGVLHRDLKPSNLLVVEIDGSPVAKIIDFGLAKALVDQDEDSDLRTQAGIVMGTPAYMAPEQRRAGKVVDVRSDLYSMGVVLFELLVGTAPFAQDELPALGIEGNWPSSPPHPSSKVTTHSEECGRIARERRLQPGTLKRKLKGDLDRIVTTALALDLDERYGSAGALADDLERYLKGKAVSVGPPSLTYLARCFVRQHRAAVLGAAVLLATILGATGVAARFAIDADRALVSMRASQARLYDALSLAYAEALHRGQRTAHAPRLFDLNLELMEASAPGYTRRVHEIWSANRASRSALVARHRAEVQLVVDELDGLRPEARLAAADRLLGFGLTVLQLGSAREALQGLEVAQALWASDTNPADPRVLSARAYVLQAYCALPEVPAHAIDRVTGWIEELAQMGLGEASPEFALLQSRRGMILYQMGRIEEALVDLGASTEILMQTYPRTWAIPAQCARLRALDSLEHDVADTELEHKRRALAAAILPAENWGMAELRTALGPDRGALVDTLLECEQSVQAGSVAGATLALEELVPLPLRWGIDPGSPEGGVVAIWLGGIAGACSTHPTFGRRHAFTRRIQETSVEILRLHRDAAPERFAKGLQFLSRTVLESGEPLQARKLIEEGLALEPFLPRGDAEYVPVLAPNTHWRMRGRLGRCLQESEDFDAAHQHMLESWIALDRWEHRGTGNARAALRFLVQLHNEWGHKPQAIRRREQLLHRLPPGLMAEWRDAFESR